MLTNRALLLVFKIYSTPFIVNLILFCPNNIRLDCIEISVKFSWGRAHCSLYNHSNDICSMTQTNKQFFWRCISISHIAWNVSILTFQSIYYTSDTTSGNVHIACDPIFELDYYGTIRQIDEFLPRAPDTEEIIKLITDAGDSALIEETMVQPPIIPLPQVLNRVLKRSNKDSEKDYSIDTNEWPEWFP